MEDLLEIVNSLQDVFTVSDCKGIDLPQIVVVGSQSAGKSSVLENIVGKSFLPRGTGIVTRCPLVLQLVHTPNKKEDFATFQHDKKRVFTDYNLVRKEIEEQTERIAGKNKEICSKSINLKIYSPSLLNLTLVDLPGIIKVPVGDQPIDIEDQVRNLILTYIQNPNSIILAVSPANVDMATSESLKIAKEVDPDGTRTLAVLTKIDLMDKGTNAFDMLSGKIIPVKLGIVGVVNRSQNDIINAKSVKESLKDETDFFRRNYKSIAENHGTEFLTKKVQALLINHIKECLPDLKERINQKLTDKQAEFDQFGQKKMDKPTILLDLISKFSAIYASSIKGNTTNINIKELQGGAKVNFVFQECFGKCLKNLDPMAGLDKDTIVTAMRNSSGVTPSIFVPELAFELLVKKQMEEFLLKPSLKCVRLVYSELIKIGRSCINNPSLGLYRYPKLKTALELTVNDILKHRLPITNEMVENYVLVQCEHVNSSHPDFLPQKIKAIPAVMNEQGAGDSPQGQLKVNLTSTSLLSTEDSHVSYVLIKELIISYFGIVSVMVQDTVPKYIMRFMINSILKDLHTELINELFRGDEEEIDDLMQESPEILKKRKTVEAEVEALEQANQILSGLSVSFAQKTSDFVPEHRKSFFNLFS